MVGVYLYPMTTTTSTQETAMNLTPDQEAIVEELSTDWQSEQSNGYHRGVYDAQDFLAAACDATGGGFDYAAAVVTEWDARRLQVTNPDQAYLLSYVGRLAYALDEDLDPNEVAIHLAARVLQEG